MAQKVTVSLVDDLDGSEATETVTFGLDGNAYEVDLSEKHAKELREGLAHFVAVARKAGRSAGRRSSGSRSTGPSISAQVREWAAQNGHDVPSRGRIPTAVMEAYRETHGGNTEPAPVAEATEETKTRKARSLRKPKPVVEPVG